MNFAQAWTFTWFGIIVGLVVSWLVGVATVGLLGWFTFLLGWPISAIALYEGNRAWERWLVLWRGAQLEAVEDDDADHG